MLFLVDALANAKSLFSANFLAFPAVADATLGLLSKMAIECFFNLRKKDIF